MSCTLSNSSQLLNQDRFSQDSSPAVPSPKIKTRLRGFLRDFQQPLTVISATTQLAQLRSLDEETQEDLYAIAASVEQLRILIRQMQEIIKSSAISNPQN